MTYVTAVTYVTAARSVVCTVYPGRLARAWYGGVYSPRGIQPRWWKGYFTANWPFYPSLEG